MLRRLDDPELGVNVVDLGLVYECEVSEGGVRVALTATTPACPLAPYLVSEAERLLREAFEGADVRVELTWEPPWAPERMSAVAREWLGWEE